MSSIISSEVLVDTVLRCIVTLVSVVVGRADGASVTLDRGGKLQTVASSNETVAQMDAAQYETGEGPCLDAARTGSAVHLDSVDDERRWPSFTSRAGLLGIRAVVSSPLSAHGIPAGALNIYSQSVGAFEARDLVLAQLFASEASLILSSSLSFASATGLTSRVQEALVARRVIAQAEGVIIEREGIAAEEAYTVIRRISITSGRTLRDEADVIVRSATTQTEAGDGRSGRDG